MPLMALVSVSVTDEGINDSTRLVLRDLTCTSRWRLPAPIAMPPIAMLSPSITSPLVGCFAFTSAAVYIVSFGPTLRVSWYVLVQRITWMYVAPAAGRARIKAAARKLATRDTGKV